MDKAVIDNMRSRVERCRRLAAMITDTKAIAVLEQMAREGEDDIRRLEGGSDGGGEASPDA